MSQPFAIRCCTCQSIWEAESLSTLIQCPFCLAILELASPAAAAPALDQQQIQELRWELARQMTIQASARWRQRLLAEQPQLADLPQGSQPPWWTDQRIIWRGLAIAGILALCYWFAPWQLTLSLLAAICYGIVIHPGWNRDEKARQAVALHQQTEPLLTDLPRSDFARGGRFANTPFDATAWLHTAWGNHLSGEIFQLLGWQQEVLLAKAAATRSQNPEQHQAELQAYLHETKPVATDLPS
jgi:hypothetical protein